MALKLCLFLAALASICNAVDPEAKMTVPEIITHWGYQAYTYSVVTKDGYRLKLHRIPHGRTNHGRRDRPVVFLQHGLLCSSSNWVTNLPSSSLGFILADAGYDVWMGNVRGNTYSNEHLKYNTSDPEFWDFSWDEMAKYDLPAMIDYALSNSGRKSLYYIGHSQGTMMAFAGLSMDNSLASKIDIFFALAPVAKVGRTVSPIRYMAVFTPWLKAMFGEFGIRDFMPSTPFMKHMAQQFCPKDNEACDNVLFLLCGYDTNNLNSSRVPVYFSHTPAGTSVQNILHFGQMVLSEKFQTYDHGSEKNRRKYGQDKAPEYKVNLTTPVYAFSGGQDWLANPNDVRWLISKIPHLIRHRAIPGYNHLDFIWGKDANEKVYKDILRTLAKYENGKAMGAFKG